MNFITYVVAGLLGVVIGSFLNVVILRLHAKTISKGRSRCVRCNHVLKSGDLFPIFSYLLLKGRCRYCGVKISKQYILVETLTLLIFVLLAIKFLPNYVYLISLIDVFLFIAYCFIFSLLIVLSLYDIKHFILPWKIMRIFLLSSFILPIVVGLLGEGIGLINFVAGFIVAAPFYAIWYFSNGKLIGFGDIELMCGAGFLLGVSAGFMSIIAGFWIATVYVFLKMFTTQKIMHGKTQIPFGPFLALGLFIVFFMDYNLNDLVLNIFK